MREENQPIRLECFTILSGNQDLREEIGFVLIQMRSIPFWNYRKNGEIKSHWHKLICVSAEWRSQKPELLVSVSITQKESIGDDQIVCNLYNTQQTEVPVTNSTFFLFCLQYEEVKKHIQMEEELLGIGQIEPFCDMLTSQKGISVKLAEEGFIQIGHNAHHRFMVEIILQFIDMLPVRNDEQENSKFLVKYNLLGTRSVNSKIIYDASGKYCINEKITIKFRSSLDDLKAYFMKIFYLPIEVLYCDEVVGN